MLIALSEWMAAFKIEKLISLYLQNTHSTQEMCIDRERHSYHCFSLCHHFVAGILAKAKCTDEVNLGS